MGRNVDVADRVVRRFAALDDLRGARVDALLQHEFEGAAGDRLAVETDRDRVDCDRLVDFGNERGTQTDRHVRR